MDPRTAQQLIEINRRFYSAFGPAFATTRRRIQDGVRRVLSALPDAPDGAWLDLGCGPGALAAEWLRSGRQSRYLGLDFSAELLEAAREAVAGLPGAERVGFARVDLSAPGWAAGLAAGEAAGFSGVLAFAVLHHLPGQAQRLDFLRQVRALLADGGRFYHSEWQFQNSPKLMARRLPWSNAGIDERALEPGDTLLDWRFALPGQAETSGLRYVHLFSREELDDLAAQAGFRVLETFSSDGQGGSLSLYQCWQKI